MGGGRGVVLYGAYAADVNLDSSALTVPPHGTEASSSLLRTAKEWRNACVEEPTARCFALVLSSADQHVQAGYQHDP